MAIAIDASTGSPSRASAHGFRIVISLANGDVVVSPHGDIDSSTSPTLALALASLLTDGHTSVVLDLTDVAVLDPDRAWVIGEASRLFAQRDGRLTIVAANAGICAVLQSADLGWLLGEGAG